MVNILLGLGKSHKTVLFTDIPKIQQEASIKLTLQLSILPGVRIVWEEILVTNLKTWGNLNAMYVI